MKLDNLTLEDIKYLARSNLSITKRDPSEDLAVFDPEVRRRVVIGRRCFFCHVDMSKTSNVIHLGSCEWALIKCVFEALP